MAMFDPFSELDRLSGTALTGAALTGTALRNGPRFMPVDLYQDGDRYILNADMPGIDPGTIDVDVDGQVLTIRAQRTAETRQGAKWLAQERPYGSYVRQFSIGEGIDRDAISASYDTGVLSLIIPVSERAKPRKIEVTAGENSPKTLAR